MRYLFLLLFMSLTGCIGHTMNLPSLGEPPDEWPYQKDLIGLTYDQLVLKLGAPSHKNRLGNGTIYADYQTHMNTVYGNGRREHLGCTIKLLLNNQRVVDASTSGNWEACDWLMETGEHNHSSDLRHPF